MTVQQGFAQLAPGKTDLGGTFIFEEVLQEGGVEKINKDQSIILVDVNSNVRIGINQLGLAQVAGTASQKVSEPLQDLTQKRDVLLAILDDVDQYVQVSLEAESLYVATHNEAGIRLLNADTSLLQNKLAEQGDIGVALLDHLFLYVVESRKLSIPDSLRGVNSFNFEGLPIENQIEIAIELEKEGVQLLTDAALPDFINREITKLDKEADQRRKQLLDDTSISLRLQASLIKENGTSEFIHLPGYDSLKAGVPTLINRLSFELNEQEQADLAREIEFNTALAERVRNLRQKAPEFNAIISGIIKSMQQDLQNIRASFSREQLRKDFIEPVRTLLQEQSVDVSIKNKVGELEQLATKVDSLHADLIAIRIPESLEESILLISSTRETIRRLVDEIDKINLAALFDAGDASSIPAVINDLLAQVAGLAGGPAKSALQNRLTLIQTFTENYASPVIAFSAQAKRLISLPVTVIAVGVNVDVNTAAFNTTLNDVKDTELQIVRMRRAGGELIQFNAQILNDKGVLISEYSQLFRIETFGLHTNVSASLFFVNRLDDKLVEGVDAVDFAAVPGVSYLFEFTSRGRNGFGRFWNAMNPGIGFTTALLTFEGSDPELGLGVAGSLFGGVLEAGYGYNFQVDDKKGYFYIGFDLFEAMNALRNP
ncbi:MAG: hypothetical protein AB8G77_24890 [Rhodothermales bacterium]